MQQPRRLLPALLWTLGALDLTRCGLLLGSLRSSPGTPLAIAGLAAAAACLLSARAYRRRQHWSAATALLIGIATAPQAAAAGFRAPFTIPDLASISLGSLVAVIVLSSGVRASDPPTR
ncbi:MAG TPA: hypothetical protein VHZ96_26850 [Frankiaceae bacterium]|jgi:hypothetical protein|nr:hypothetical protein [Frankiaceae bacterium]